MKKLALAAALVAGGLCVLQSSAGAHGGTYRGPGDTVPPGGGGSGTPGGVGGPTGPAGGPTTPGGLSPTGPGAGRSPGGSTPGTATPGGASGSDLDLTAWTFWWEFNKEPFLSLKAKVYERGIGTGDDYFIGDANQPRVRETYKPTEEQIRQKVVPALLAALRSESNNDIVTGCMIALAKIGDPPSESADSPMAHEFLRFLADRNQEISETAAVALGILANPSSIPTLESLLQDRPEGRRLVDQPEVGYRTRAFAAYGLGLIGAKASNEGDRQHVVEILRKALEADDTKTRDLKVSCIIAMGLVPLETIESSAQPTEKGGRVAPETSRTAQLDYLLSFLQDESQNYYVRAHCPGSLARLLVGLPPAQFQHQRERIAGDLIARLQKKSGERDSVVQSAVLALGLLGTNDAGSALDVRIREALIDVQDEVGDQQARNFAMIALAKLAGTTAEGAKDPQGGIDAVSKALLAQLAEGKSAVRPWAGLACGVMVHELVGAKVESARIPVLQQAVREAFAEEREPARLAALAVSSGIMGDVEAKAGLLKRLQYEKEDSTRGYVALALGLMSAHDATDPIQKIVDEAKYRPDLLKQAAIALGLLGDKDLVPKLVTLLQESKGLATQASLSSALGFIGDHRSIDPLVAMLQNENLTERARGFAAVALGIVADKELLPWNSKIGVDLNYRAATQTLTDQAAGTGILDIL